MCERDVSIESCSSGEINHHFASDRHWERDVTYRVHNGLPVYNQLRQAVTLTDDQLACYAVCGVSFGLPCLSRIQFTTSSGVSQRLW